MAESDVYCNVVMNLGEVNISNKTLFTLTFYEVFHILKYAATNCFATA